MSPVAPGYLAESAEAGVLHRTADFDLVADAYTDPSSGRRQALVEYWHPRRPAPDPGRRLAAAVAGLWPDCLDAVVRTEDPDGSPGEPFGPYLTYLALDTSADAGPAEPLPTGLRVLPAGPEHQDAVAGMLRQAFEQAQHERGWDGPSREQVDASVSAVLLAPDRRTLVAERDGRCVGQATVLMDAVDDPTGTAYAELLDVLVTDEDNRAIQRALVARARLAARQAGLPLLGHVVHGAGTDHGERVVAGLRAGGWRPVHSYRIARLRPAAADGPDGP